MIFIFEDSETDVFVMRTALPKEGDTPTWSDTNCEPFDDAIWHYIKCNINILSNRNSGWFRWYMDYYDQLLNFIKTLDVEYTIYHSEDGKEYSLKEIYTKKLQEE